MAHDRRQDLQALCARLHDLMVHVVPDLRPTEREHLADDLVDRLLGILLADAQCVEALRSRLQLLEQRNAEVRVERTRQVLQLAEMNARIAQLEQRLAEGPAHG